MSNSAPRLGRRLVLLGGLISPFTIGHAIAGTITDAKGNAVSATAPQRIVSIGSSVTEIIIALGRAKSIAAIDTTSLTVPGAEQLPNVGYMRSLAAEGVLAMSPDLICATSDSGPPEVLEVLRASGRPLALVPHVADVNGILDKIKLIGDLLDETQNAAKLSQAVKDRAAFLESKIAGLSTKPRVLFILSLADRRLLAGGAGTAADTVITMAGGTNIAAAMTGYKPLAMEVLLSDPPDAIVMMSGGGPTAKPEDVFGLAELASSPAAMNKALHVFDGAYLLGFGPRTIEATAELAMRLHPDLKL